MFGFFINNFLSYQLIGDPNLTKYSFLGPKMKGYTDSCVRTSTTKSTQIIIFNKLVVNF